MNSDGSDRRQLTQGVVACIFPFWSPDGRLAYSLTNVSEVDLRQRGTRIIAVDQPWEQQTPVALPPVSETSWFNGHAWSPNGQWIAGGVAAIEGKEARNKDGIFIYSFATNRYEQVTDFGLRPQWLNDSRHLVFAHSGNGKLAGNEIWVVDTKTKFVKPVFYDPTHTVATLALTRDNRRIIFSLMAYQSDLSLLSLNK